MARIILALIGLTIGFVSPVFGHEDARWIQTNPDYVSKTGGHCCGVNDCAPVKTGEIQRIPGGWFHVPTSTALMDNERGVYASETAIPFRCVWGGALKCFFPAAGA